MLSKEVERIKNIVEQETECLHGFNRAFAIFNILKTRFHYDRYTKEDFDKAVKLNNYDDFYGLDKKVLHDMINIYRGL